MDVDFAQPKLEPDTEPELDELDEDYGSEEDRPEVFKIRDALEEPVRVNMSINEIHKLIHDGSVDLNPPYQRDVVWPESKQIALIDSLFRNFYIPPIVFAVTEDEEGQTIRVCVDGKQRLTSIQQFCDGQIPHKDILTKHQFWYTLPETHRGVRTELPEWGKKLFSSKFITCTVEGGLSSVLQWDTKRGRDFQNIAYLVCCCASLPTEAIPTAQKMEKWLSRSDAPAEGFKADIKGVLGDFLSIAYNKNLNSGLMEIGSRLAPVEFIYIGVLLYVLRRRRLDERAAAITYLRQSIRKQFKDIRINSSVCKSLWAIIRDLENNLSGLISSSSVDGDTISKGRKRKKKDDEEDDDDRPMFNGHTKKAQPRSRKKGGIFS
ncbi:hypothetical protein H0H81_011723 [Sphagnurus paluster]|uniref:GmrSD restriction endonucleases N-terminal domain-containing protein n=1 Tax=Sphagnurus paluster TaxID=117069 RepID=A0A9P7GIY6_9AGAR|nr:hypothetical protein H0H81_011723 [Sphagnurus paluster]